MKFKKIQTEKRYRLALKHVQELMMSDPTDQDKVDVLSMLIEDYERKKIVIEAPLPHEAIRFRMNQLGLKNRDLEPILGSRSKVSEILSGKRPLSIDMVRDLNRIYGIPLEALIGRPNSIEHAFKALSKVVADKLDAYDVGFSRKRPELFLTKAFGGRLVPEQLLRKTRTQRANERTDSTALVYWQAAVLSKAKSKKATGSFKRRYITESSLRSFAKISSETNSIVRATAALSDWGIRLVYMPTLPGTYLDGAVMLDSSSRPVVALTGRHDRIDNFWFSLLHELSHICLHMDVLESEDGAFLDDLELKTEDVRETEADDLAVNSLIPASCFADIDWSEYSSNDDIQELAESAEVNVAIAAGRWQREHANYKKFSRLIERGIVRDQLEQL